MRLLVVEDEVRLAHALRRGLTADGYAVDIAHTGPAGLDAAREGDYDAVLLDVMLPGMSGYDVVRTLRAEQNWVPVLMVSAKDGPHDQADGLDCGADDYLVKPLSYVVVLAHLRALLRRPRGARPVVLSHGDVRLDPATHEVTLGRRTRSLSPREYLLLEYFLRHPGPRPHQGRAPGPGVGPRRRGDPNNVEVYVGYLRRKLGRTWCAPSGVPATASATRRSHESVAVNGPWQRWSLRDPADARSGCSGLAAAQAVGSVALAAALHVAAERRVEQSALATSGEVVDLIEAGRATRHARRVGTGDRSGPRRPGEGGQRVAERRPAHRTAAARRGAARQLRGPVHVSGSRVAIDSELRVWAQQVTAGADRLTVVVAEPDEELVSSDASAPSRPADRLPAPAAGAWG